MRDFMEAVRSRVVVFDGGMGATLEQFDLTSEDYGGLPGKCHEALILHRPDVIQGVHESMLDAGAEVVETDTFQASRLKLGEWGLADHTLEINTKAAQIARQAAGDKRFVAGSIGPTGYLPASEDPSLGQIRFGELVDVFAEQAQGLVEGGADLIIIETAQDILEVKAAVFGAREAFKQTGKRLPIQTSVSLLPNGGKMLLGTDIQAVLTTLLALDVDAIGLNCSTGPEDMRHAAGPGAAPDAGRRAGQLAGLAQGEGAAAGRRLRRAGAGRRGPGDRRRPRARRLRRADRAPGRGRADARGRQAHLAQPAGAD